MAKQQISKKLSDVITVDNGLVTIHYDRMHFKDTHLCSPALNRYKQREKEEGEGYFCPFNMDIQFEQWRDFWAREKSRCLNGYTAKNGIEITGDHYFYLNYFPIIRSKKIKEVDGEAIYEREFGYPDFYDGDWLWFHLLYYARVHNKHFVTLKARRKGFSYKVANKNVKNYYFKPHSKNYILASAEKYLQDGDKIFDKIQDAISVIDETTGWFQPALYSALRGMHFKSGYKVIEDGSSKTKGTQASIIGKICRDKESARGSAGDLVSWEEMGVFPYLIDNWEVVEPATRQGNRLLGQMLAFGTGGTEGADFEGADELFSNPDAYNCLVFNNIWDTGAEGMESGYFHPNYLNLEGFIDEDGNSLIKEARAFRKQQLEKKRKSSDANTIARFTAENAETPSEAMLDTASNLFPTETVQARYNEVKSKRLHETLSCGFFGRDSQSGLLYFRPDPDAKPILKFPLSKDAQTKGCIAILESPVRRENGSIPDNIYYISLDPYAHDDATGRVSLGAAYVYKRPNKYSSTYHSCPVASYIGRPATQDNYYYNLFQLAEYYNAKIGFENNRGGVVSYAKRKKKLKWLQEEFEVLHNKDLSTKKKIRGYGIHMNEGRKREAEIYVRDWLTEIVYLDENENPITVLDMIVFPALLKELLKYRKEGNFDRVSSLFVGQYYTRELDYRKPVRDETPFEKNKEFFDKILGQPKTPSEYAYN